MGKIGKQTWIFPSAPSVVATATVAGRMESQGPLGDAFDMRHEDDRAHHDTWEHAEQAFFDEAANIASTKAGIQPDAMDLLIGADLNAQLSSFYLGLRPFPIPALGIYAACASICEALAIGALTIDAGFANHVLCGTASHNSTAERQFRFPTEYGVQKPASAQRTVTGSGVAVLSRDAAPIRVTAATIGQVVDLGITNPWDMAAAMAPAALSTIHAHFSDTGTTFSDYDCVATGDLGTIGHGLLRELFASQDGLDPKEKLIDCGMLIYRPDQEDVFSGGSGGACCAMVTFAHLLKQLENKTWQRILVSATGALLSAVTTQQGDSIPCVSHAVVFERRDA